MKMIIVADDGKVITELQLGNGVDSKPEQLGLLGEVKVWQKLDELGVSSSIVSFLPLKPKGVDIILESGVTIDVKASRKTYTINKRSSGDIFTKNYAFGARHTRADFIVVWAVDDNDFYVIPRQLTNPNVNRIYPNLMRWRELKDNWGLLTSGLI